MRELQREDSASASACSLFRPRWTRRSSRRSPPVEGGPTPLHAAPTARFGADSERLAASSYAAIWAEAEDAPCSGSVALGDEGLALSGGRALPVGEAWLVRYADVLGVESCAIRRCG